jgi:hypothetical protein
MEQVPPGIVSTALRRLLDACSRGPGDLAPPVPSGAAAAELRAADPGGEVERVLTEALAAPDDGRARAAARLALAAGCASSGLAEALVRAWDRDARPWPIERALAEIAAREPRYLPDPRGSLRRTLLSRPELAERFLADPAWRRLGLVVYAGLDPERFPRDVAWLTRLVLDALGSGRPPDALVPELGRYAEPAETRLDALLALVALPASLPELEPEDDERLEAALRRVAARVRMPEGADKPELLAILASAHATVGLTGTGESAAAELQRARELFQQALAKKPDLQLDAGFFSPRIREILDSARPGQGG